MYFSNHNLETIFTNRHAKIHFLTQILINGSMILTCKKKLKFTWNILLLILTLFFDYVAYFLICWYCCIIFYLKIFWQYFLKDNRYFSSKINSSVIFNGDSMVVYLKITLLLEINVRVSHLCKIIVIIITVVNM